MPLIDLKTDLKSIKYGSDRPGGGDSGLPYIKTDINTVDRGFNRLRLTKFDDGLIRGGVVGALNASVVDTIRIGKFLTDFPKGPLFIARQVGLQLSNPRLEVPKSLSNITSGFPDNTLAATTNGLLEPTRIYNLGINTIAQIPVNAFGGHFNRHGILPIQNPASKYEAVVTANNKTIGNYSDKFGWEGAGNRLIRLSRKFQLGDRKPNTTEKATNAINSILQTISTVGNALGFRVPTLSIKSKDLIIDDYTAGPGSTYGIGRTIINRYSNTEDELKIKESLERSSQFAGRTRDNSNQVIEVNYLSDVGIGKKAISSHPEVFNLFVEDELLPSSNLPAFKTYADLKKKIENQNISSSELGFPGTQNNIDLNRDASNYKYYNGKLTKDSTLFNRTYDGKINYDIGNAENDIFPVIFAPINPFIPGDFSGNPIQFLAYLNNYDESYDSTWNEINYIGRAESFYIFNKFKRTANIDITIPAFNKDQLKLNHKNLFNLGNKGLAYSLAGQYNTQNLLGGVITRVTIGNYLNKTPGIISSLRFNIIENSPWDVDEKYAHYIKCSFSFTVIGDILPQYQTLKAETTKRIGKIIGSGG